MGLKKASGGGRYAVTSHFMDEGKCQASVNLMGFAHTTAVRGTKHLYLFTKILHHQAIYLREVNIQKNCLKSNCQLPCAHTQTAHNAKVNGGRSVNPKRLCMIAFQILLIVSNKTNFGFIANITLD